MGFFLFPTFVRSLRLPLLLAILVAGAAGLTGCSTDTSPIAKTVGVVLGKPDALRDAKLNPKRHYLRVSSPGHGAALLVREDLESLPAGHQRETWYSRFGELIQIENGRIVATSGLHVDWREVRLPALPDWTQIGPQGLQYTRERDQMPGYRMGLRETVQVRPLATYAPRELQELDAASLQWFEEDAQPIHSRDAALPAAHFALQTQGQAAQIVYAEQCLAQDLCLSWQRWPPRPASDAAATQSQPNR